MDETTWRSATIVWARASDIRDFTASDLAAMGEGQLARFRGLKGERAAAFLTGRALIRQLVLRLGGGPRVPLDSICPRCRKDHVAPRTPGFVLSVSHAGDLVAVAASTEPTLLGIDVEHDSAAARVSELGPVFPAASVPDLAGWTRIEAAIKADGRGVEIDPGDVRLRREPGQDGPEPDGPGPAGPPEWSAALPGRATPLQVATLPGPTGYTLSAARG
ncbi:4'-phosphopantetheinyl transferase family protein [Microbacterium sp. PMB16]|uniref:4'-phosphopantetheinyl transferase family protein n=1 Tax=Microbacterium sp. PMB16 TaxID=3120157 RepID=UPI003F4C7B6A